MKIGIKTYYSVESATLFYGVRCYKLQYFLLGKRLSGAWNITQSLGA